MTPAVKAAERAGIVHRVLEYDAAFGDGAYGVAAAEALGQDPARVFKTLVVALAGGELAVAIVPVAERLDLKAVASALGAKRAEMAPGDAAERATGYVLGGISPLGQRRRLRTVVDETATAFETLFVSGGKRGVEIELAPGDLLRLISGTTAPIARREA